MSRRRVEELDLPHTVWAVVHEPQLEVQRLAADSTPLGPPGAFRDWTGTALGMVLRNDLASETSELDARYLLASARDVTRHPDGSWDALVYLSVLEPGWTPRQYLRARGRKELRLPRTWETVLYSDEHAARRARDTYGEPHHPEETTP